jgi:hypothetical protein
MSSRTMQHGNLQMALPEGWSDATQIVAAGPVEDGFRSSLAYTSETLRPRETPPQFAARMLTVLKAATEQFQLVNERTATFGQLAGFLREYTHVSRGVKLAQLQFYVVREGGVVHMFTFTQKAERMQASRAVAERLFASASVGAPPSSSPAASGAPSPMRARPSRYIEPRHMRIIAA